MSAPRRKSHDPLHRATRISLAGSLLTHLVCLSVLAAIALPRTRHFNAGNSVDRSQMVLELKESTQRRVAANDGSATPVVIKPYSATVEGQRMVATPASKVRLEELLDLTERTKVRKHLPPSAAGDLNGKLNVKSILDLHSVAKRNKAAELTSVDTDNQVGQSKITRKRRKREFKVAGKAPAIPPDFSSSRRPYNNQPPTYPSLAIDRGWIGTVVLQLSVDRTGKVIQVKVLRSSGYRLLDAQAVSAIRLWRGKPAMKDGQTIATVCNIPIEFAQ